MPYALVILTLIFIGCQSTQEWLATKPLSYQKGYKEGCDNGEEMAANSTIFKKNDTPSYKTDPAYKKGWDEGYQDCYSDKEFEIMTKHSGRF